MLIGGEVTSGVPFRVPGEKPCFCRLTCANAPRTACTTISTGLLYVCVCAHAHVYMVHIYAVHQVHLCISLLIYQRKREKSVYRNSKIEEKIRYAKTMLASTKNIV